MGLTLLTGGARSGKSALAVRMASAWNGPVSIVVTGEPRDEEMTERIRRHRAARPAAWTTIEEPIELEKAVASVPPGALVIVDCLTLWVSNLLERGDAIENVEAAATRAANAAADRTSPVLVVTNEVGSGIVPMNPTGRGYRDLMGVVNATFARSSDRAYLVVAGRALALATFEEVIGDVIDG